MTDVSSRSIISPTPMASSIVPDGAADAWLHSVLAVGMLIGAVLAPSTRRQSRRDLPADPP
ncbi:hypothetical protein [Kribbella sp. CA-247076]|uniref:hypothetical protein n=1 Tax=Kribbella sp. CA-247076 TaxID=3239941 RepID=UPI003D905F92